MVLSEIFINKNYAKFDCVSSMVYNFHCTTNNNEGLEGLKG